MRRLGTDREQWHRLGTRNAKVGHRMALRLFSRKSSDRGPQGRPAAYVRSPDRFVPAPAEAIDKDPLKALWQQQRYSAILARRHEWANHPDGKTICTQAAERLER